MIAPRGVSGVGLARIRLVLNGFVLFGLLFFRRFYRPESVLPAGFAPLLWVGWVS